jgi:hypothetical protein
MPVHVLRASRSPAPAINSARSWLDAFRNVTTGQTCVTARVNLTMPPRTDHQRDDARDRQILERVDGIGFERVDLLGHLHRADLGANTGANAPSHEEAGYEGAGFANERNSKGGGNHYLGAEALERGACVHREHNADRDARREDERRGAVPELIRMPEDFAQFIGRTSSFDDGVRAKRGDCAGKFQRGRAHGSQRGRRVRAAGA